MLTVTPKEAYNEIVHVISRGLVPFITSSPGLGKSSIIAQVARDHRLKLIDLRLSQMLPEDLNGLPMRKGDKASFTPFDTFPLEGEELPLDENGESLEGWFIFLDEMTSATKPLQAAAYKLILDKMVGQFKLHPNVAMAAAGNKMTDKAVVNQLSTALQSRVIHYELSEDARAFNEYAHNNDIDFRIISFLSFLPSRLMDFRPDHNDRTFACPRTWEFLSRLIKDCNVDESIRPRVAGTIGNGVADEFITFVKEFDRIPKIEDIVKAPKSIPIPAEMSTKFATVSMLIEHLTEDNVKPVFQYLDRFETEMRILFMRGSVIKHPDLAYENDTFVEKKLELARYLS